MGTVEARASAAEVVRRVTDDGAYSNVLLASIRRRMDPDDARLVTRLVMTAIRYLGPIDEELDTVLDRPRQDLDAIVLALLRVAIGEMLVDSGHPHVVVDQTTTATRVVGMGRASGYVNGVLRAWVRRLGPKLQPFSDLGIESWILERVAEGFGDEGSAREFFAASNRGRGVGYRLRNEADAAVGELGNGGQILPGAGYTNGTMAASLAERRLIDVIDPASTAAALAVEARPGDRVLDAAAAPGGKTAALWDQMGGEGMVVAADRHARRLQSTRRRLGNMRVGACYVVADATRPPFRERTFDRILLDAPCTGLGTLSRRPEIRHRIHPDAPAAMAQIQTEMLDALLTLLRPGGRLVYSVCTVFAEETTEVVAGRGALAPDGLPGRRWGDGLLLAPHLTGTDGMFIAVMSR